MLVVTASVVEVRKHSLAVVGLVPAGKVEIGREDWFKFIFSALLHNVGPDRNVGGHLRDGVHCDAEVLVSAEPRLVLKAVHHRGKEVRLGLRLFIVGNVAGAAVGAQRVNKRHDAAHSQTVKVEQLVLAPQCLISLEWEVHSQPAAIG